MHTTFTGCVFHERSRDELTNAFSARPESIPCYTTNSDQSLQYDTFLTDETWQHVRRRKVISCIDVIVGGWIHNEFAIVSLLRGNNESYPNTFSMFGGNIPSTFTSIEAFLYQKVHDEGGVTLPMKALFYYIGTYLTRCPKTGVTTLQVCYFTEVSPDILDEFITDQHVTPENAGLFLFTQSTWRQEPTERKYWYQERTFNLIWNVMDTLDRTR